MICVVCIKKREKKKDRKRERKFQNLSKKTTKLAKLIQNIEVRKKERERRN